jgi:hypothetical protein
MACESDVDGTEFLRHLDKDYVRCNEYWTSTKQWELHQQHSDYQLVEKDCIIQVVAKIT